MKPLLPAILVVFLLSRVQLAAGPIEDAIMATARLADVPNYSWSSTVTDDARTYEIDGQTVRGGYTRVRMPVVNRIRRKLGRDVTDAQVDALFRGNVDCVLLTDRGWLRPDELGEPSFESRGATPASGVDIATPIRAPATPLPLPAPPEQKASQPYSNLQLAISHPHEELGVIVGSHESFGVEGNSVSGNLTPVGAQLLLVRAGQTEIIPIRAQGTFKLWLRGGLVTRYQLRLEGVLSVQTPRGRAHVTVQQSALTEIRQVGATSFEVPDDVRAKLRSTQGINEAPR